jgi:hypothetical protein
MPELEIKVKKTYTLSGMSYMELCILTTALDHVGREILGDLTTKIAAEGVNVVDIADNLYEVMVAKV